MEILIDENTPLSRFDHHWKFCVGSAHAAYALRHDYVKQLAEVHDDLGVERVRFHGVFGDDMRTLVKATEIVPFPFGGGYREQSFRQCAVAYDNVLEAGMKPFVELGFMPKLLAKLPFARGAFFYKPIVSLPKSIEKWQDYIRAFTRFLIDRYGREEVESWYFEVWNEPDLPVVFFDGGQKDYFKLYRATAEAVKSADEHIRVGGPATSGSKWIAAFLDYCEKTGAPVDFVSTHQYAGDPIGGIENKEKGLGLDIDVFAALTKRGSLRRDNILDLYRAFMGVARAPEKLRADALTESAKNVKALAGDKPVFYTEWNMCASFSAPCNDTPMPACYLLHTVLHSQGSVDGSSVWCFSDLFEEFHQFPEEFHGGFGLMTQSGIKKPSYRALQFLNEAGDERFDTPAAGNADAAVFKKENGFHILASLLDFEESGKTESVTVRIKAPAPSRVTLTRIDETHCNPLRLWREAGCPQTPPPRLIEELKTRSAPAEEPADYTYEDGFIVIPLTVSSNEIKRVAITL
ncbi:MAG: hypothetical protein IK104_07340 [Clostridia bacterium]|nr:hypothetical protein [Clostridia bacterium]